ncbi:protein FAM98C [Anolis carolinensis]|nr:PREDICTED: protein FAM98C [Anolis carolinensis]|eukprot:XP_003226967.2 PREDICTED: protein FAM98C [Anolis carolinensis]
MRIWNQEVSLGCTGTMEGSGGERCLSMEAFAQVAEGGVSSPQFTALCSWLVSELRLFCPLEEDVNPTEGPEDAEMFQIEVSGLLNELNCPYPSLTKGDVTARLSTPENCLQLLYFLSSELLAARLQARKAPRSPEQDDRAGEAMRELHHICKALGMEEPDPTCSIHQLMADIESKILEVLSTLPAEKMAPLLKVPLSTAEWETLSNIHKALQAEYQKRKRMMATRLDVTVASFHWSERAEKHRAAMTAVFEPLRQSLLGSSQITLAQLLAAREDFSRIIKTSSGASRDKTSCAINKVLMVGDVPDRGGRPGEIEPPMPIWEKRREGGGGGGGHQRWGKRSKKKKK